MSGYCPSCGNTLCVCDQLNIQEGKPMSDDYTYKQTDTNGTAGVPYPMSSTPRERQCYYQLIETNGDAVMYVEKAAFEAMREKFMLQQLETVKALEERDKEAKAFCKAYNDSLDTIGKLLKELGRDPADY